MNRRGLLGLVLSPLTIPLMKVFGKSETDKTQQKVVDVASGEDCCCNLDEPATYTVEITGCGEKDGCYYLPPADIRTVMGCDLLGAS